MHKRLEEISKAYGKEPTNCNEMCEAIIAYVNSINPQSLVGLAFEVQYSENVSNSHSCPHNGVQNFSGDKNKPRSYPGLSGRIWYRFSDRVSGFSSNIIERALVHTGTGGGGSYGGPYTNADSATYKCRCAGLKVDELQIFSMDVKIFLDDFPAVKNNIDQHFTFNILQNKRPEFKFSYNYLDESVLEQDRKIIEMSKNLDKMPKLIGIVGLIGSGKSTVANNLKNNFAYKEYAFAAKLKSVVCTIFGWSPKMVAGITEESREWRMKVDEWWAERLGIPHFTPRWALQNIGTDLFRQHFHDEIWIASLEKSLDNITDKVIISDCRFPNEIDMIHRLGGIVIRVSRDDPDWIITGDIPADIHESEVSWMGGDIDYIIDNNGSLDQLKTNIRKMFEHLLSK